MGKYLFCLLLLLSTSGLWGQAEIDYTPLAERLAEYGRQTMSWNTEALLDLTDPQLFEIVDREMMASQLAGLRSDHNMEVSFSDFTVDDIGRIVKDYDDAYAPVNIHHRITFRMLSPAYKSEDFMRRMQRMLEKNYGSVTVDASTFTIKVVVKKSMFAIQRGAKALWCFVEYRPENAALMDLLVPPVVREQFKK